MTEIAILPPAFDGDLAPWRGGGDWRAVFGAWAAGGRSTNTVEAYARWLEHFFAVTGLDYVEDVRASHLVLYRSWVFERYEKRATRNQALAAVRALVRFAEAFDAPVPNDRQMKAVFRDPGGSGKTSYQVLTPTEREAVLEVAGQASWDQTVSRPGVENSFLVKIARSEARRARDTCLIMVALGCGLRATELVTLRLENIRNAENGMMLDVLGKGEKWRTVPAPKDTARAVYTYLDATGRKLGEDTGPLIVSEGKRGGGIGRSRAGDILRELLARAGVVGKKLSLHSLRHTYAMECLAAGVDIVVLAKWLGHQSINTTMVYLEQYKADQVEAPEVRARMP